MSEEKKNDGIELDDEELEQAAGGRARNLAYRTGGGIQTPRVTRTPAAGGGAQITRLPATVGAGDAAQQLSKLTGTQQGGLSDVQKI